MYHQDSWMTDADMQEEADRQTASLGGVAITLVLLILGLLLVRQLHTKAAIEDCLMAGRINCDLLVTGP